MKEIDYKQALEQTVKHLEKGGIFLTVGGEKPNTMTIGWATIGCIWNKPVFMALVRPQRHTYELMKQQGEFTVSVPTTSPLKEQLIFAGRRSGRDVNKFKDNGITAIPAQKVNAPVIAECGLHFECKTLLTQDMTGDRMAASVRNGCYPSEDYHTMFFGEIVACYTTDE